MGAEPRTVRGLKLRGCLLGGISAAVMSFLSWLAISVIALMEPPAGGGWDSPGATLFFVGLGAVALFLYSVGPAAIGGILHAWIVGRLHQHESLSLRRGLLSGGVLWMFISVGAYSLCVLVERWTATLGYVLMFMVLGMCVGLLQGWLLVRYIRGAVNQ